MVQCYSNGSDDDRHEPPQGNQDKSFDKAPKASLHIQIHVLSSWCLGVAR